MSASADKAAESTDSSFLTALVANAALLGVEVLAFVILKQKLERIYYPRTFLPPPERRSQRLPKGVFGWLPALIRAPTADIIQKNGLDSYMFIRFLRLLVIVFFVNMILTIAVLVPVNNVGVGTYTGLKSITWENIGDNDAYAKRFAAHIIVVYILTFFTLYMLRREMNHFVRARHQFLLSDYHQRLPQSRTVLITNVPEELASEKAMQTFASFIPGGIDRVWFYRDTRALNKLFEERQKACKKLEGAESKLLRLAVKSHRKKQVQHDKLVKKNKKTDPESATPEDLDLPPPSVDLLNELVPANKRPHHRTGFLGLIGKKVDSIEYWKFEIDRLNKEIDVLRSDSHTKEFKGSVFVRCNLQMGAHILAQTVSHHEPLRMTEKWMEAHPKDVVWANLDDGPVEMKLRKTISWAATIALIVFWAIPVAFVGTVSNVSGLCENISWLAWLCKIPSVPLGIIEGFLPPVLLAVLFALLPVILRFLAWYSCLPRYSLISTNVYKRYFAFLVIHGFLIVTLSAGIVNAIKDIIDDPTNTVSVLATKLPGASTFFLTYILVQGLAGAGGALAQLVPIVMYFIKKRLLGSTPRQTFDITYKMPSVDFGTLLPRLSLIATIGFAYSILSPLINAVAFVSFTLFFIAYKFLFMQVYDQPEEAESGGMYFPMAISNLFVGLYIEQLVLAILFFLKVKTSKVSSIIEGVLMIILLLFTIGTHSMIRSAYEPITNYLPMDIATIDAAERYKQENENELYRGEMDLFSRDHMQKGVRRRLGKIGDLKHKIKSSSPKAASTSPKMSTEKPRRSDEGSSGTRIIGKSNVSTDSSSVISDQPNLDPADAGARTGYRVDDKAYGYRTDLGDVKGYREDRIEEGQRGDADYDDAHAFDHPALSEPQPWIWVPRDPLGLSGLLVSELTSAGVEASDVGAVMSEKGVVDVSRGPPDEEWKGGNDK